MIQWISETFGLVARETWAVEQLFECFKNLFSAGSFQRFSALLVAIGELMGMLMSGTPVTPFGEELDLTGYSIVFEDEFEGDSIDWNVWRNRYEGPHGIANYSDSQVSVKDGALYLTGEYLEDGKYGEGWYAGEVALKEKYTYGYYEARCIANNGTGFWSAFWMRSDNPYDPAQSLGGPGGAEIDILESLHWDAGLDANKFTMHVAGIDGPDDEGIDSYHMPNFYGNNIYTEYNTYGLLWTEDEYILYMNGVECMRTSFGNGVCEEPMEVLLSLCIPGDPNSTLYKNLKKMDHDVKQDFIIDYVRIYQLDSAK